MFIQTTYKFIKNDDGIIGFSCGKVPKDSKILEEIYVLKPSENMILKRIETEELLDYVVLRNGDVEENYIEIEEEGKE